MCGCERERECAKKEEEKQFLSWSGLLNNSDVFSQKKRKRVSFQRKCKTNKIIKKKEEADRYEIWWRF